jgi:hypothetical protein
VNNYTQETYLNSNYVLLSRFNTVLYQYTRKKMVKYCKYIYIFPLLLMYNGTIKIILQTPWAGLADC